MRASSPAARRPGAALDLPGIELPPVPVASADFDAAAVRRLRACRSTGRRRWPGRRRRDGRAGRGLEPGGFDPGAARHLLGQRHGGRGDFETNLPHRLCRPAADAADQRRHDDAERAGRRDRSASSAPAAHALTYACACASSAVAIGEAMRAIRAGWIDVAIAGGSESMLTPGVLASWQAMRVLVPLGDGG
jgi:3-oxoacyl-[acyl-carrier-protein] synthase II